MGVISDLVQKGIDLYLSFTSSLPSWGQQFVNLFLWTILIFFYVIIVWKFYKFIARKNILDLNLSKYNTSDHPIFSKIIGGTLYLAEYILILPFLVSIWFVGFSIFILLMGEGLGLEHIAFTSAVIIGAIRFVAYTPRYGHKLAEDVSKLLPFTLLAVAITRPDFVFNFQRVLENLAQIVGLFDQILIYLGFIIVLEIILRTLNFLLNLFGLEEQPRTSKGS